MKRLKKIAFILMLTAGIASLTACGKDKDTARSDAPTTNEATDGTADNNVLGGAAEDVKDDVEDAARDTKDAVKDAVDGTDAQKAQDAVGNGNAAGTEANATAGADNTAQNTTTDNNNR